ncbi:hypothetical protein ABH13_2066 [Bacillus velezensis]|nr:hypothetical protein U471_20810 [Bacillus amyloliquefaciens CC178]AKL76648.1 hypothetical protein ABH13_2066 [Bacillus velezensis]QEY91466.1 hypothetical protein BACIT_3666 [Bacillus amyloliquefaciens]QEY93783.1 hypothetical protein BACIH_2056 [Bacillus amyloliquefaciens]RAP07426.1 hypothetical protein HS9_01219 [Bacillus velezensis]
MFFLYQLPISAAFLRFLKKSEPFLCKMGERFFSELSKNEKRHLMRQTQRGKDT